MIDVAAVEAMTGAPVRATARLGGGDVAQSFRVELGDGATVFAKTHDDPPPGFFSTEAAGLAWLREGLLGTGAIGDGEGGAGPPGGALSIPTVIGCSDDPPLLVLSWIDESGATIPDEAGVGRALAALHRSGAPCFGREDRRTTGSRRLPNDPCETWVEFYAARRLLPLARLAADAGALSADTVATVEALAGRLDQVGGPPEAPARLHGDLWAGNRVVDAAGASWLIDPAAHGGHREFDLAMMRLFGGFGPGCFAAYDEASPLADGWEDRVALHHLAPLIVHAIKFGGGYRAATEDAVARYR